MKYPVKTTTLSIELPLQFSGASRFYFCVANPTHSKVFFSEENMSILIHFVLFEIWRTSPLISFLNYCVLLHNCIRIAMKIHIYCCDSDTNIRNVLKLFNNTFQEVSLIITAIGITTFVAFHVTFKSRQMNIQNNANHITANGKHQNVDENHTFKLPVTSKILYFLRMPLLYQTSLL